MNKYILILMGIAFCDTVSAVSVPSLDSTSRIQKHLQLLRPEDFRDHPRLLGNAQGILNYTSTGYSGFRSVFQWNFARQTKYNNGFHNFLQFFSNQFGGYIGFQNSIAGSNYNILFSVWDAVSAQAAPGFTCQPFTGQGDGYQCFQDNYDLEDHKLYYLDVELAGKTFTAYISEPQVSLDILNMAVNRTVIGAITMADVDDNLYPYGYYMQNYSGIESNCTYAQDITVVNFATTQYKIYEELCGTLQNYFMDSSLYSSDCEEVNQLITVTEKRNALIYLTRPTIY